MLLSIALALALMSTPSKETHPICVQRFDVELRPTRATCIEAGGEVASVRALRDGGLVALVSRTDGAFDILTWAAEPGAAAPLRHRLAVSGEFWGPRLREDGDLVLLVGKELLRVRLDGRITARLKIGGPSSLSVAIAAEGAWLLDDEKLTWKGFDGSERAFPAPSAAPGVRVRHPQSLSNVGRDVSLLAMNSGDVLVIEDIGDSHPVKGAVDEGDVTVRLGLTRVDRDGRVLGQRVYDEARKHLQWFWRGKDSSNPGPLPTAWGLVRTRWSGVVTLSGADERLDGTVVVTLERDDEDKPQLVVLDRGLRDKWSRRVPIASLAGPPHWSRGLLFIDAHYEILAVDDAGKGERRAEMPFPRQFSERS